MTSDFVLSRDRSEPGRVTGVNAPERGGGGPVPADLLGEWEAAYRDYASASDRADLKNVQDRLELAQLSARVAVTWRRLAVVPGIEWWLVATFSTAAEAMEQQARDWIASPPDIAVPDVGNMRGSPPRGDAHVPTGRHVLSGLLAPADHPVTGPRSSRIQEQREACNRVP